MIIIMISLCLLFVRCVNSNVCVCVCFRAYHSLQHVPSACFSTDGVDYSSGGGVSAHLPLPHSAAGRPRLLEVRHSSKLTHSLPRSDSMNLWQTDWLLESHWLSGWITDFLILWLNHRESHRRMALPWCDSLKHFIWFIALEFGWRVCWCSSVCVCVRLDPVASSLSLWGPWHPLGPEGWNEKQLGVCVWSMCKVWVMCLLWR